MTRNQSDDPFWIDGPAASIRHMWKTIGRLRVERDEARQLYRELSERIFRLFCEVIPLTEAMTYAGSDQALTVIVRHLIVKRDEARDWARRMKRERDTARALYDGLSERVHELDDAVGDWRWENEKLQRALEKTIDQREELEDALNLSEKESYHILQATKQLRRAMLGMDVGLGRFEEMTGEPLVVIEEATRFISAVVPKMEEE